MKANIKLEIFCHEKSDNNHIEYSKLDISYLRLQKNLKIRDKNDEKK